MLVLLNQGAMDRCWQSRAVDADTLFDFFVVSDFVGEQSMRLLQLYNLRRDRCLVILQDLAPLE